MDKKLNHFLVKVSSGVTTEQIVEAAKANKDKIFFGANGQIIVGAAESDKDPIKYGVDKETQDKIEATLKDFIDGTNTENKTVKAYVDDAETVKDTALRKDIATIITGSDCLTIDSDSITDASKITNALKLVYVAATDSTPAHIALSNKNGKELTGVVNVSDIIGNGMLKTTGYNQTSGILTLTFNQADGKTKDVEVDLKAMLDIDDIVVADDSKDYITATTSKSGDKDANQLTIGLTSKTKYALNNSIQDVNIHVYDNNDKSGNISTKPYIGVVPNAVDVDAKTGKRTAKISMTPYVAEDLANIPAETFAKYLASASGTKKYVDDTVAAKNVTAKGDTYVTASATGNEVTVSASDSTKASLALADSAVQSITPQSNAVVDKDVQLVTFEKTTNSTAYTLTVGANKGELTTVANTDVAADADKFPVTTYGLATAGNVHDFVMAYVAYVLDNYNPWTTYEGK